jgi:hypothetical protein
VLFIIRENQFYLNSLLYKSLPFNGSVGSFGSDLNGMTYKRRSGVDGAGLPPASWFNMGKMTLRP